MFGFLAGGGGSSSFSSLVKAGVIVIASALPISGLLMLYTSQGVASIQSG
jgi:hypothetical protein